MHEFLNFSVKCRKWNKLVLQQRSLPSPTQDLGFCERARARLESHDSKFFFPPPLALQTLSSPVVDVGGAVGAYKQKF
jgi:hypothetical protein